MRSVTHRGNHGNISMPLVGRAVMQYNHAANHIYICICTVNGWLAGRSSCKKSISFVHASDCIYLCARVCSRSFFLFALFQCWLDFATSSLLCILIRKKGDPLCPGSHCALVLLGDPEDGRGNEVFLWRSTSPAGVSAVPWSRGIGCNASWDSSSSQVEISGKRENFSVNTYRQLVSW